MFYDEFEKLCKLKGVSRTKACTECGVSRTAWHKWKDGAIPNGATINKLAEYFGIKTDFILGASKNTDAVISDISQYEALLSWIMDNKDVPDEVKYVISNELPNDPMAPLSALSCKAMEYKKIKTPTPVSESGQSVNIVRIAGRDGRYMEKRLTDEQIKALQTIIDQMPEADDL